MREDQYAIHDQIENEHWWFRARRRIILRQIKKLPGRVRTIAEIGCGTGGNLQELECEGYQVVGADVSPLATDFARKKLNGPVYTGDYSSSFARHWHEIDVILLADVLEHVKDDQQFLNQIIARARPGTRIVITVPAFMHLWSQHDVILGHFRRYNQKQLVQCIEKSGAGEIKFVSYFNSILYTPIATLRLLRRLLPDSKRGSDAGADVGDSDLKFVPGILNFILYYLFLAESLWLDRNIKAPIGVSLIAVFEKGAADET